MAKSIIGTDSDQVPTNGDLGAMAFQDKAAVSIEGGVINNAPIGGTTPSTGAFTTTTLNAGSAAAPSLTFAGDTNTGIYAVGADAIGISTGGVERLQVAADGGVGLGAAPVAARRLNIGGNITGAASGYVMVVNGTFQSDVTNTGAGIMTYLQTQAASFTLTSLIHYSALQGTIGAGSTVATQTGFVAGDSLIGATNNYGFRGRIPSGTGRWNLFMEGTASNYLNGNLLVGTTTGDGVNKLQVNGAAKATQWNVSAMATAPASATATGTLGEVRITATHIYVCTATDTWVRAALDTWT